MQAMQRLCYIFAYTHVYVHNMCTYTICVRTQYMICTYRLYNRYRNLDACLHAKTRIEWKCPETCASEFAHTYAISYIWDSMYVHKYSIPRHMMQRRGTWSSIPRHMVPRNIPRSYMGWLRCIPRHEVIWGGYDAFRGIMCLGTWCIPRRAVSSAVSSAVIAVSSAVIAVSSACSDVPRRHHVPRTHDASDTWWYMMHCDASDTWWYTHDGHMMVPSCGTIMWTHDGTIMCVPSCGHMIHMMVPWTHDGTWSTWWYHGQMMVPSCVYHHVCEASECIMGTHEGTWCIPHHVSEVHRNIPRHHVSGVHDAAPLLQGGEDS